MIDFDATNSAIARRGRFVLSGAGLVSGWQGSQLAFKVSGTLNLKLTSDVLDPDNTTRAAYIINVDKGVFDQDFITSTEEIFTGERSHTFTIPDTGEHTIIVKPYYGATDGWDISARYNIIKTISIDNGGSLTAWGSDGPTVVGVVGDSWMGVAHDWPFLLSDRYTLYPMSFGGARAFQLEDKIDYMHSSLLMTDEDPVMDILFVNSAVNDYNSGISNVDYEVSLGSLIDKLRVQQPTATIYIVGSPDNTGAGKTFSQYNVNMIAVANARANVKYISLDGIGSLGWFDDNHLDFASRQLLADWCDAAVIADKGYQVQAGSTKPWVSAERLESGRYATEYDGSTPYSFNKPGTEPVQIGTPSLSSAFVG